MPVGAEPNCTKVPVESRRKVAGGPTTVGLSTPAAGKPSPCRPANGAANALR
jgi:hypothetical protein